MDIYQHDMGIGETLVGYIDIADIAFTGFRSIVLIERVGHLHKTATVIDDVAEFVVQPMERNRNDDPDTRNAWSVTIRTYPDYDIYERFVAGGVHEDTVSEWLRMARASEIEFVYDMSDPKDVEKFILQWDRFPRNRGW